jgi:hypothetical protein
MKFEALTAGTKLVVTKGSPARSIYKGEIMFVHGVELLPATHANAVKLSLLIPSSDRTVTFYAKHVGQLHDAEVSLQALDPGQKIKVRRA